MPDETEIDEFARLFTGFLERMQQRRRRTAPGEPAGPVARRISVSTPSRCRWCRRASRRTTCRTCSARSRRGSTSSRCSGWPDRTAVTTRSASCSSWREYDRFGIGAVDYQRLQIDVDEEMDCVAFGFYLGVQGEDRYVALLRAANPQYGRIERRPRGPRERRRRRGAVPRCAAGPDPRAQRVPRQGGVVRGARVRAGGRAVPVASAARDRAGGRRTAGWRAGAGRA